MPSEITIKSPYLRGIDEIADYARVGEPEVRKWIKDGLRYTTVGKTFVSHIDWVDDWLLTKSVTMNTQPRISSVK